MMKRFLSALLCACVLISMTGCAQDQEAPEDLLYSSAPIQFNSDSSSEEESSSEPEESQAENSSSTAQNSSSQAPSSSSSAASSQQSSSAAPSSSSQASSSQASSSQASSQSSSSSQQTSSKPSANNSVTAPSGEMRAVWFSYLDLSSMIKQKSRSEFESAISKAFSNVANDGYNTVFVQVRPFGDALYDSDLFPWSYTLTGTEGVSPGYDPLQIMIDQAHAKGLSVEAWVNPYRIRNSSNGGQALSSDNPASDWLDSGSDVVIEYGGGIYYNPGSEEAREHIVAGVEEIVRNYDVDGIHFDDYFYPTTDSAFDADTYSDYKASGGKLSLGDWRRDNVDQLVREVYSTIKSIDSSVRFGISPQGNTSINYSEQYIDVEEWLSNSGYVDYICPQVYYGFENDTCPFAATVAEWNSLIRRNDIDLYIGISASKIGLVDQWAGSGKNEWVENDDMLVRMVSEARKSSHYSGFCMYSYRSLYAPAAAVADQVEQEKEALSELM